MSERNKALYARKVTIRLKHAEYEQLCLQWHKTTYRKFSEYARKLLLSKPVKLTYRNASADAFLEEMLSLKKELSALGNNFNQAVKRLHTISTTPEIRVWVVVQEKLEHTLLEKADEIRRRMSQIYELWSHE